MRGRSMRISPARRFMGDFLWASRGMPLVVFERRMHLARLVETCARVGERPMWTAMFAKAFGLVSRDMPALRRAYVKFPWPHFYETAGAVAAVTIEREYQGEDSIFIAQLKRPEDLKLTDISQRIGVFAKTPIEGIKDFVRAMRLTGLPRPLRRILWWLGLNIGRQRANYFGTFGLTSVASEGAMHQSVLSPLSFTITYGVIDTDGTIAVQLAFDHRVIDGRAAARALARLEEALVGPIADEVGNEWPIDKGFSSSAVRNTAFKS